MRTLTISDPGLISGRRGYAAKVLSLGPIAYWPMEETSGTTMVASIGANGTYVNGPTLAVAGPSAKIPKAVSFDGLNDYAFAALDLSAMSQTTISFWLAWTAYANNDRLAMEHTPNWNATKGILVDPNSGDGVFGSGMSEGNGGSGYLIRNITRPSAGAWHHFAIKLSRSAGTVTIRVDGSSAGGTAVAGGSVTGNFANSTLYLMSRGGGALFGSGSLCQVAVFSGLLPDADCDALCSAAT